MVHAVEAQTSFRIRFKCANRISIFLRSRRDFIPNHDGALAPGIYCTIELHIPRKTPSFRVSADAVIFNDGGLQVAVVESGAVHLRKVSVRDLGQEVEINSGVKAGDQVILNPAVRSG